MSRFGLLLLLCAPMARAAEPARDHEITVEDYFTLSTLFEVAISPDGKQVAYVEGRWQKSTDDRKSNLWIADCESKQVRRLTGERGGDHGPQWSADGKTIHFLGHRKRGEEKTAPYDGSQQVWRVRPDGGGEEPVTRVEGGVSAFELSTDAESLYYLTTREHVDEQWRDLKKSFPKIDYGHGVRQVSVISKLDLRTWRTEEMLDNERHIHEMSLSPDGNRLAMITTLDGKVISHEGDSEVEVLDLSSGKVTTLPDDSFRKDAPSPYGWIEHLAWSVDGKALAFNIIFDAYPCEIIVAEWSGAKPKVRHVARPKDIHLRGYGTPLHWMNERDLCFLADKEAWGNLYCIKNVTGGGEPTYSPLTEKVVIDGFSVSPKSGRAALILSSPKLFPDVHLLKEDKTGVQLTDLNPQTKTWKLPTLQKVTWKGTKGDQVEGILELPPDYKEGQKLPLLVELHGGPSTCTRFQRRFWIYGRTLFAAKGYAVLSPNYRGSTGYGDQFEIDLIGHENDYDVTDILKGVDAMIEKGIADPERLGVMGWSNGGYLTNCLITKTTRFKAASSGASIVDTVLEWGANDEPAYVIVFKKGFPWNQADLYRKTSPSYALDKVTTPTLIHVGAEDERCPPGNSRLLYRALKEYGKVPTELLVYPGEAHGLGKYSSRHAKMKWDVAWFERYLWK